ncbi:MAG: hypothetical protein LBL59_12095 [Xanthomonadaceae bacterium]|jgi:general secretion pathway protein N|nr:hypothetical protein [Xanthomonadaceae bacterium]
MRTESLGFRTWLLGVVAIWAIAMLVLALFGMGGRIDAEPAVAAPGPIPHQPAPNAVRLKPLDQYGEISRRPLLSNDRQRRPFFIEGTGESEVAVAGFDFILTSVLLTPDFKMAILKSTQGEDIPPARVKVGEAPANAPGWRLVELEPRRAVFQGPEGQRTLDLRVMGAKGVPLPAPSPGDMTASGMNVNDMIGEPVPAGTAPPAYASNPDPEPLNNAPYAGPEDAPVPKFVTPEVNNSPAPSQERMEQIRRRIQERRQQTRSGNPGSTR